jgi:hypothetical protein
MKPLEGLERSGLGISYNWISTIRSQNSFSKVDIDMIIKRAATVERSRPGDVVEHFVSKFGPIIVSMPAYRNCDMIGRTESLVLLFMEKKRAALTARRPRFAEQLTQLKLGFKIFAYSIIFPPCDIVAVS